VRQYNQTKLEQVVLRNPLPETLFGSREKESKSESESIYMSQSPNKELFLSSLSLKKKPPLSI